MRGEVCTDGYYQKAWHNFNKKVDEFLAAKYEGLQTQAGEESRRRVRAGRSAKRRGLRAPGA